MLHILGRVKPFFGHARMSDVRKRRSRVCLRPYLEALEDRRLLAGFTEFPVPTANSDPDGITAGPDGNVWFIEELANQIGRITPAGVITEFPFPAATGLPGEGVYLSGITAGPDGNIWFTELYANKIGRITPAGAVTEFPLPTTNSSPLGITAGPDGNIWFTEENSRQIGRITPAGTITEFPIPTANILPYAITAGPDGNIWFTEPFEHNGALANQIGRITPAGAITQFSTPTANSLPSAITAGPDGNIWFTESTANQIGRFKAPTVQTQFQNTDGLHKLLYAGQQLAVNVSVTNGLSGEVDGQENFYLSTNQLATVQGDTQLAVNGIVGLDLQPNQFMVLPQGSNELSVGIPTNIQPGTYYLKAVFMGVGNNGPVVSTVAVSPALTTCVNSQGQVSSFSTYPGNATVFDLAVDKVKLGTALIAPITDVSSIESFIKDKEGTGNPNPNIPEGYFGVYSDNGVPAIGWGSDLEDKDGNVNTVFECIINKYLDNNPNIHFTFQDFLDFNTNVYIDKTTAEQLFNAWFQTAYNYVTANFINCNQSQIAALTDIAYNVGVGGLLKFTNMIWV